MAPGKILLQRFKNEKDEEIYVRVKEEPFLREPGVLLYVARPDSDAEMHITRQEAQELSRLLSSVLRGGR